MMISREPAEAGAACRRKRSLPYPEGFLQGFRPIPYVPILEQNDLSISKPSNLLKSNNIIGEKWQKDRAGEFQPIANEKFGNMQSVMKWLAKKDSITSAFLGGTIFQAAEFLFLISYDRGIYRPHEILFCL